MAVIWIALIVVEKLVKSRQKKLIEKKLEEQHETDFNDIIIR